MYKSFKKLFDKEEGYILVTSFVVLLVIMILGVVYANLAITQSRQAEQHNDRKQAYYYARSGSERAYEEMRAGLFNSNIDRFDDFSWNLDDNIDTTNDNDINKKVNVDISIIPEMDESNFDIYNINEIEVVSTGRVGDIEVNKRANYILTPPPSSYTPPPVGEYPDSPTSAQEEGWVEGSSGVIYDTGDILGDPDQPYYFRGPGNSLRLQKKYTDSSFQGEVLYFDDLENAPNEKPIQIVSDSILRLYSNEIVFYINIELIGQNDSKYGNLSLIPAEDDGQGIVYFGDGINKVSPPNDVPLTEYESEKELQGAYIFKDKDEEFDGDGDGDGYVGETRLPYETDELTPYQPDRSNIDNWDQIWE